MVGLRSLGVATLGSILALDKLGGVPPETSRRLVFLHPGSWLAGGATDGGPVHVNRSGSCLNIPMNKLTINTLCAYR